MTVLLGERRHVAVACATRMLFVNSFTSKTFQSNYKYALQAKPVLHFPALEASKVEKIR